MHKEDKDEIKIRQEQKKRIKKDQVSILKILNMTKYSFHSLNNVTEDKIKLIKLDNPSSICEHLFKKEIEEIKCPPF